MVTNLPFGIVHLVCMVSAEEMKMHQLCAKVIKFNYFLDGDYQYNTSSYRYDCALKLH